MSRRMKCQSYAQILHVSTGEVVMRQDLNLALVPRDLDRVAQVTRTTVDLDPLVEKFLKGGHVENLVAGGLRGVDGELSSEA
jgi:hypothetical protein